MLHQDADIIQIQCREKVPSPIFCLHFNVSSEYQTKLSKQKKQISNSDLIYRLFVVQLTWIHVLGDFVIAYQNHLKVFANQLILVHHLFSLLPRAEIGKTINVTFFGSVKKVFSVDINAYWHLVFELIKQAFISVFEWCLKLQWIFIICLWLWSLTPGNTRAPTVGREK